MKLNIEAEWVKDEDFLSLMSGETEIAYILKRDTGKWTVGRVCDFYLDINDLELEEAKEIVENYFSIIRS